MIKLLMGNQAMGLGALHAGVQVVTGYPGTPSTEVLETIVKNSEVYVEWSVNEKSALEVSAGAAYTGCRTLVTMKQVGLNVATDPLMSLAYVGVKGGMVVLVADDPGPISSQTEQDTRNFAQYSKLPVFDPTTPEEAYEMMKEAFELSEKYSTPVLFRPTTRICHACACVELKEDFEMKKPEGFVKDSKWVIFPRLSYGAHIKIEERNKHLKDEFSAYAKNSIEGNGKTGIATGGISYAYTKEALNMLNAKDYKLLKVATPFPFPEKKALEFLEGLKEVMVYEELDPVIEKELVYICGKYNLDIKIKGKLTHHTLCAGENSTENACEVFSKFLNLKAVEFEESPCEIPLPQRAPVLCAGCPHRASFYAVKQGAKNTDAIFAGDIGCYTLGNALPLNMVDTCLCMGAGLTIAQGIQKVQKDTTCFAFIGDSTFFHTGLPGIVNAVYNEAEIIFVVLDNSTTAMTGKQENPATGRNIKGEVVPKINIEEVLKALGVKTVVTQNPFDLKESSKKVKELMGIKGVRGIVFRAPCIAVSKKAPLLELDESKCVGCKKCIRELGCPAISFANKKSHIDENSCYGCGICGQVCPVGAIGGKDNV